MFYNLYLVKKSFLIKVLRLSILFLGLAKNIPRKKNFLKINKNNNV